VWRDGNNFDGPEESSDPDDQGEGHRYALKRHPSVCGCWRNPAAEHLRTDRGLSAEVACCGLTALPHSGWPTQPAPDSAKAPAEKLK
jgi:hypothetical protein